MNKIKISKVDFLTNDSDELLCLIDDYFTNNKIQINSQLMAKAIKLSELYGFFYYIAVKINDEYNAIYITDDNILN